MPFAGYKDFAECVRKNQSKDDPKAYCADIQRKAEKSEALAEAYDRLSNGTGSSQSRVTVHVKDMATNTNRVVHDWLLEHKPEAAEHDAKNCSFCVEKASTEEKSVAEDKIFTQEQHDQLLEAAVNKAIESATSKMDAEVLRLNDQVEAHEATIKEKDEEIDKLNTSIKERDEASRLADLGSERVDLVKAKANFTDEQLEARKEQWAKMDEDDFNAYLEDIDAVAKASKQTTVPDSLFEGTRDTASDGTGEVSILKAVLSGDLSGLEG